MKVKKEFKFEVKWSDGYIQKCKTISEAMAVSRELLKIYRSVTVNKL